MNETNEANGATSTVSITQVRSPAEIAAVEALLREYTTWAFSLEPDSDFAPTFQSLQHELSTLPGIYAPPAGRLLLAVHDGQAGCIALKPHDATTGELKRVYVRPGFRGLSIGRKLLDAALTEARLAGYRRLVLDSHISMTTAHALYESAGFRRVPAPADFPESLKPIVVFMEMELQRP